MAFFTSVIVAAQTSHAGGGVSSAAPAPARRSE
jgi:hypothetical protein